MAGRVVVVSGGGPSPRAVAALPTERDALIAADSGLDAVLDAGLVPDLAIGDFDSVTDVALAKAAELGVELRRYPEAKDETDLDLALAAAMALRPEEVVVIGGGAGRFDHLLASVLCLASPRWRSARVTAVVGDTTLAVVHGPGNATVPAATGATVSLVPVHGTAVGVTTSGLRWTLTNAELVGGTTWGVSNVVERAPAEVRLAAGTLAVIVPPQGVSP